MGRAYAQAGALAVPAVLLPLVAAVWLWGSSVTFSPLLSAERALLLASACLAGSWLHEMLHALGWRCAARIGGGAVRIGWSAGALAPCAILALPVPARAYRWGVALPGVVTGLAPLIIGLACACPWLLWWGMLLSVAALGDALVLLRLRGVPASTTVRDHPTRAGCIVGD